MLFTAQIKVLNGNYFVTQCEKDGVPKSSNSEGPAGWATSFEKLLEDPLGLHTFAVSFKFISPFWALVFFLHERWRAVLRAPLNSIHLDF